MDTGSFWSRSADDLLGELSSSKKGLSPSEARRRLERYGPNALAGKRRAGDLELFLHQFANPIILILLFAAVVAFFLGEKTDTTIILVIVLISGALGFWQERGAANAVEHLLEIVEIKVDVIRDGKQTVIPIDEVVPGDVAVLNAGDAVPGDCLIIDSSNLFVDEATLTGETFPVEKERGTSKTDAPFDQRPNMLFMGTHIVSGTATAVVVKTGIETTFGGISKSLREAAPETDFERGIKRFGFFLLQVTLILVIIIFAINVYLKRPVLDSFLFSLALAVGLTPQLLPAIISINLSHGARNMAKRQVIVKRLASIENFGSMNVLCTDKTGTITEGVVEINATKDVTGGNCDKALLYSYLNAHFETSFMDPIDEAIRKRGEFDVSGYKKLNEIPYDFIRKRLSVALELKDGSRLRITKGALAKVLEVSTKAEMPDGSIVPIDKVQKDIERLFEEYSDQGLRTLGVAYQMLSAADTRSKFGREHEHDMIFLGFLLLADPPKKDIKETIARLRALGVTLKIMTGDNVLVARSVARQVGMKETDAISGAQLHQLTDEALDRLVDQTEIFAEVEPNQKERILHSLRRAGNVAGYLGDGINDAPAIRAADVGISVDTATDVAKEAADIVLLKKSLRVLTDGVTEGRTTFANTLKYIFMAVSANFGNMFSMAGASLFLPFLPLLPKQILLTNLLTDFPETTISTDRVDRDLVDRPRRWDLRFIRRFMLTFGLLSSVFDYVTFGVLLLILHAGMAEFRTGWFMESVISASFIVLVIRTRKPFWQSRPSRLLIAATVIIGIITILIPYSQLAGFLGFKPIPAIFLLVLAGVMVLYVALAEVAKFWFYKDL